MGEDATTHKRTQSPRVLQGAALVFGIAAVGAALYFTVFTFGASIDGKSLRLSSSATAGEVFERNLVARQPGDLVSAKSHKVLVKGGGGQPYLSAGGRTLSSKDSLRGISALTSHDGTDAVEATRVTTQTIPVPVRYEGSGPIETTVATGSPGVREVTVGAISGQVVRKREKVTPVTRVIVKGYAKTSQARVVCLTFDDGPWPTTTKAIIKILKDNGVKGTFFQIGRQARHSPSIARAVTEAGLEVANHSENHSYSFGRMKASGVLKEISQAQYDIKRATGKTPTFFRPPGGITNKTMGAALKKLHLGWVLWNVDTGDWKRPSPGKIVSRVMRNVRPGAVVLMHDGGGDRTNTVKALPTIIKKLREQGYTFVNLDELPSVPHRMG
jgi:peptidoglycan-N-acetylglucosamine deacetylase